MKLIKAILGFLILPFKTKVFRPEKVFKGKRVAVVGAADSAYDHKNGHFINGFDYVIRINKSLVTWDEKNEDYLGTKCDVLFHNFHENMDRGGAGKLDWKLFKSFGLHYLVQPRFDRDGWRSMFNYFKKYLNYTDTIFILPKRYYKDITDLFDDFHPTKGFCALYSALTSECEEVFVTGFTFFKTPYAEGYRDNIRDVESNRNHIRNQGLHDINLEFLNFLKILETSRAKKILVDSQLYKIVEVEGASVIEKILKVN